MVHGFISKIIHTLYPSSCPVCSRATDNRRFAPFCSTCWDRIIRYSGPSCTICASPFVSPYATTCPECLKSRPSYSRALAYGLYGDVLASVINTYKFQGMKRLAHPLGDLLTALDLPDADMIVPVPLSSRGLRERGFNQSLLLAKTVAVKRGIPLGIDRLRKQRETRPQIGLSAKERAVNLRGAFSPEGRFDGLRLLLVDDVMTTGSTVRECSRQLMSAGATDVVVVALARASAL